MIIIEALTIALTLISSILLFALAIIISKRDATTREAQRGPSITEMLPAPPARPVNIDVEGRTRVTWRQVRDRAEQLAPADKLAVMRRIASLAARADVRLSFITSNALALADRLARESKGGER